jgi:hypothetical protein
MTFRERVARWWDGVFLVVSMVLIFVFVVVGMFTTVRFVGERFAPRYFNWHTLKAIHDNPLFVIACLTSIVAGVVFDWWRARRAKRNLTAD